MAPIQCPNCMRTLSVPGPPAGGGLRCPLCGAVFVLPISPDRQPTTSATIAKQTTTGSTTKERFDPYYTWLGIPPHEQPADYYRILGLAKFEANPDVIDNAANRQMAHVRTCSTGPRGVVAQEVLNALALARTCLLDVKRKSEYDLQLRDQHQTSRESAIQSNPSDENPPATTSLPLNSYSSSSIPAKRTREKSNPTIELIKIIGGGAIGLCAAYLVLLIFFPSVVRQTAATKPQDSSPRNRTGNVPDSKPRPSPRRELPENPPPVQQADQRDADNSATKHRATELPNVAIRQNESPSAPDSSTDPFSVVPESDPPAGSAPEPTHPTDNRKETKSEVAPVNGKSAKVNSAVPIPTHTSLPSFDQQDWVTLVPLPSTPTQIELVSAGGNESGATIVPTPSGTESTGAQWGITYASTDSTVKETTVAQLQIEPMSGDLQFRWVSGQSNVPFLGNHWLKLQNGTSAQYVALRSPLSVPPIKLDLEKERLIIPLVVDAIPATDQLYLELSDLTKVHGSANFKNGNNNAKFDREVVIEFKDVPGAEIGVKFAKLPQAPLGFIVEPRFKEGAAREYDLTLPKLEKTQQALQDSIQEAKSKIPILSRNLSDAQSLYKKIDGTSISKNYSQRQKQIDLARANGVVRDANRRLNSMREQEVGAQARLGKVPQLADFMRKLHGNEIGFRVLVRASSAELLLATGTIGDAPK